MNKNTASKPKLKHGSILGRSGLSINKQSLKRFGVGFLLMPWILIWGWFSTLCILLVWFLSKPEFVNSDPVIASRLDIGLAYPIILVLSGLTFFIFYCINYLISSKFRWARYLILISIFYTLLILSLQFYPYFIILLQTSV